MESRSYTISGRVQGVGFRWFTQRTAERIGLVGWVRNLPDGRVEVVAQGPVEALADLERALRSGSRIGRVEHVEIHNIPHDTNTYKSFDVR